MSNNAEIAPRICSPLTICLSPLCKQSSSSCDLFRRTPLYDVIESSSSFNRLHIINMSDTLYIHFIGYFLEFNGCGVYYLCNVLNDLILVVNVYIL